MKKIIVALLFCFFAIAASASQVLTQWGQDNSGTTRNVYILDPTDNTWIAIGAFNTNTDMWQPVSGSVPCASLPAFSGVIQTSAGSCVTSFAAPVGPANGGTGVANPTAHAIALAEGSANFNFLAPVAAGDLPVDQGPGNDPIFKAVSGDCSFASSGAITCTKTGGVLFGALATLTPGTGVGTALGNALNATGGVVGYSGSLGTPTQGVLTHATGLPLSTGITGFGTGVATALADNVNTSGGVAIYPYAVANLSGLGTGIAAMLADNVGSAGAPVAFNGGGGTPSSLTLTNASGLPISGVAGWGTGVAAAAAQATNSASGFIVPSGLSTVTCNAAVVLNSSNAPGTAPCPSIAPINVKLLYGATGNGVTDDTTAIQNAINAACSAGGGRLYFPYGTYKTSATLTIQCSNVGLEGDGTWLSSIAIDTATGDTVDFGSAYTSPVSHNFIYNISIGASVLPTPGSTSNAISAVGAENFWLENVNAYNRVTQYFIEDTINFYSRNTYADRTGAAASSSDTYIGMHFTSTSAAVAAGFTNDQPRIYNFTSTALASNGTTYGTSIGAPSYGLKYDGYNLRNLNCIACDFDTTNYGFYADGTNANGAHIADIRLTGSASDGYGAAGFYFQNLVPSGSSGAVEIVGGWTSAGQTGLSATGSEGLEAVNVVGLVKMGTVNIGNNNKGYSVADFITNSKNIHIVGNHNKDFYIGTALQNSSGTDSNFDVSHNDCWEDSSAGSGQTLAACIAIYGASNGAVSGNVIAGSATAQVTTGIYATGTLTNVWGDANICDPASVSTCVSGANIGYNGGQNTGQTYVNETSSRVLGTSYTNTEVLPIVVMAQINAALSTQITATIGGNSISVGYYTVATGAPVQFTVPPGATYAISDTGGSVSSWWELR